MNPRFGKPLQVKLLLEIGGPGSGSPGHLGQPGHRGGSGEGWGAGAGNVLGIKISGHMLRDQDAAWKARVDSTVPISIKVVGAGGEGHLGYSDSRLASLDGKKTTYIFKVGQRPEKLKSSMVAQEVDRLLRFGLVPSTAIMENIPSKEGGKGPAVAWVHAARLWDDKPEKGGETDFAALAPKVQGELREELAKLLILDSITEEMDRHHHNVMYQLTPVVKVWAADNDTCDRPVSRGMFPKGASILRKAEKGILDGQPISKANLRGIKKFVRDEKKLRSAMLNIYKQHYPKEDDIPGRVDASVKRMMARARWFLKHEKFVWE